MGVGVLSQCHSQRVLGWDFLSGAFGEGISKGQRWKKKFNKVSIYVWEIEDKAQEEKEEQ